MVKILKLVTVVNLFNYFMDIYMYAVQIYLSFACKEFLMQAEKFLIGSKCVRGMSISRGSWLLYIHVYNKDFINFEIKL